MPWKPCPSRTTANASLGKKAAFLSQVHQEGLNHPSHSDLLNAEALIQLLSLGPGRTPYRHASLLAYTTHVPRKPVPSWARGHPKWSPGRQLPSECHLVQIPYDKIRDFAPARLPESSLRCRHTLLPLRPPKTGARPQRKEGIHVRTYSTYHGVSLAQQLLPRPRALKTSRPLTSPRGFPVSYSPEVPWDMQLAHLPCSLPASSLTGSSGQMVRPVYPPALSSPFCTSREAGWKCL